MQVALCDNGPLVSALVAGVMTWGKWGSRMDTTAMDGTIRRALELGLTTFDHADIYGDYTTEEEFGQVLARDPSLRQRMQLISKCGIRLVSPNRPEHGLKSYDTGYAHIVASVDRSLRNLHTDYLDLLLIHRPSPLMEAEQVANAVAQLKQQGKVRYFGVSNFTPSQVELLRQTTPLVTNQVECSPLHPDPIFDGTFDQCQRLGMRPMVWSPLGGGDYFSEDSTSVYRLRTAVQEVGQRYGDPGEDVILLAWLLRHPAGPVPVLGTTKTERMERALQALAIRMEDEDWFRILEAARGREVA